MSSILQAFSRVIQNIRHIMPMVIIMDEQYYSLRLAMLRTKKKVSAREMSLALGQNDSYINRIEYAA